MNRRNLTTAEQQDLDWVIRELHIFLAEELGYPATAGQYIAPLFTDSPDREVIVCNLWDAIRLMDPEPADKPSDYIGDNRFGLLADEAVR